MKKLVILSASAVFAVALALSVNFNSAKNELAAENAAALAEVQAVVCVSGWGKCLDPGFQWHKRNAKETDLQAQ